MNYFKIAIIGLLFPFSSNAQSITIRDIKGTIVNNDTLVCEAGSTQKPPLTKIDCYLFTQNTGSATIVMGAKKAELSLSPDMAHNICFANQCFVESVFISPLNDTVPVGSIDSSFSGHCRFDETTHTPSRNLVAYTFYDVNNPADSAIVYVIYNTMPATGIKRHSEIAISISPNPANDIVRFGYNADLQAAALNLVIVNATGQIVDRETINSRTGSFSLNTAGLSTGAYYYSISMKGLSISKGRFMICR
jgi:hypothetical protein